MILKGVVGYGDKWIYSGVYNGGVTIAEYIPENDRNRKNSQKEQKKEIQWQGSYQQ